MLRSDRGFTLIELMIVVVIVGILAAIALANYGSMQNRARVSQVRETMHIVHLATEEFATRNNGEYPQNAAAVSADGGVTLASLLPGGAMPENPFTLAATTLDWSNVLGTAPATDPAGGVALNVSQTVPGGIFDAYDIIGTNDAGVPLALVLKNY